VFPDPSITGDGQDRRWMKLALDLAERGRGRVEPNPMVGAVVVRDGRQVGQGHHEQFGGPHAEIHALEASGRSAHGATLYVTLEPCCHFGKTPPCTDRVLAAGVSRVVAAIQDPFPRVNGGGISILRQAGVIVDVGCLADDARRQNAPYWKRQMTGMPYVTAKWAMTLDGKTATVKGDSRWISSDLSREAVHELRSRMDGIIIGISTAECDDPLLTARVPHPPRRPVRIVLDSSLRLSEASRLVQTARETKVLVATTDRAPGDRRIALEEAGCEVVEFPSTGGVPVDALLRELGNRQMTNILIEGGGRVAGAFLDAGQIDGVDVFVAPMIEGGDHSVTPVRGSGRSMMNQALRLRDVVSETLGPDARIRGWIPQEWRSAAGFRDD
jgi:diaminohydroxyphosphoribosylaminopyrimidine deaminase/5-amino-6-(5-phosphoribosylamino)uracil reductase